MFDLLLESSHQDDSNKRSNIGFGQEIMELASIEVYFTHVIWSSEDVLSHTYTGLRATNCNSPHLSVTVDVWPVSDRRLTHTWGSGATTGTRGSIIQGGT